MNELTGKTILTLGSVILIVPVKPLIITAAVGGALAAGAVYYLCKDI